MKKILFVATITLFGVVFSLSAFADPCEVLLAEGHAFRHAEGEARSISTSSLITYLSRLLEQNLIGDEHLVRFSEGLERGEVVNPISEEEVRINTGLLIQRGGLEHLISETLDQDILLTWVREKLSERKIVQVQREVVHQDTEIPLQPMEFVPIQPGTFMMGEEGRKVEVTLTNPFEIGVFQVTQWQWAMVMGQNPSHFVKGSESTEIEINGVKIKMQPNHPVEMVSWNDIHKLFLPRLNALSKADDPLIYKVILGHIPGKIYRLPEEAEWEYAARAGTDTMYSFGDDEAKLPQYAWFDKNANGTTHAVGLKNPNPWGLYDVHGNVGELMEDSLMESALGSYRVFRGGSWNDYAKTLLSAFRLTYGPDGRFHNVGFRLVRE